MRKIAQGTFPISLADIEVRVKYEFDNSALMCHNLDRLKMSKVKVEGAFSMNGRNRLPVDELNLSLGAKIRSLRQANNLKIADFAEMTGLTSSMISQLERALISPSISTLKKICEALNIPISYLFDEAQPPKNGEAPAGNKSAHPQAPTIIPQIDLEAYSKILPPVNLMGASPVVHKETRKFLSPGKGVRFYLLNPNLFGPIEFIYNEYDPGATTGTITHPGSECGLILSGELVVMVGNNVYMLKEGDSITFNSFDPHMMRNDSDKMCTCVWANVPPWF